MTQHSTSPKVTRKHFLQVGFSGLLGVGLADVLDRLGRPHQLNAGDVIDPLFI